MVPRRRIVFLTSAFLAVSVAALWASKEFVPPRPASASIFPSKDAHPNEHVTAAVDVYNGPPKDDIFMSRYNEEGILPVLLVVTNDGDRSVTVKNMHAQLVTSNRSKLEALEVDDVFRRVAHIKGSSNPRTVGPITLPAGNKNKKAQQQYEEIINARFAAASVEPHTTKSGFLFFDVQGVSQPVTGAHVYLTGINDDGGNELMYFEIPVIPSNAASTGP
jgi:hypothetical protein